MHNLIASLAKALGWKTWYHVTYTIPTPKGLATGDTCVCISPWLRQGATFSELREYLKTEAEKNLNLPSEASVFPNIVSITRIGA